RHVDITTAAGLKRTTHCDSARGRFRFLGLLRSFGKVALSGFAKTAHVQVCLLGLKPVRRHERVDNRNVSLRSNRWDRWLSAGLSLYPLGAARRHLHGS